MKYLYLLLIYFSHFFSFSQNGTVDDTTFYEFSVGLKSMETGFLNQNWGAETVTYLGLIHWRSPSGKKLQLKIVTSYQKIIRANGFNDRSLLAIMTTKDELVKIYDMVSRQNLPIAIANNKLVLKLGADEKVEAEFPKKLSNRFCVVGLNCFNEIINLSIP